MEGLNTHQRKGSLGGEKKKIPKTSTTGFVELLIQRDYGTHDSGS